MVIWSYTYLLGFSKFSAKSSFNGPSKNGDPLGPYEVSSFGTVNIVCCCSVAKSCLTLSDPMDCNTQDLPVHHQHPEFTQIHVHCIGDAIQPPHPLLSPPSIFPSIRVFSNESVLRIRWPNYLSFNFSISPSNECSGLISLRMDWLDLLSVQGTLKSQLKYICTSI